MVTQIEILKERRNKDVKGALKEAKDIYLKEIQFTDETTSLAIVKIAELLLEYRN